MTTRLLPGFADPVRDSQTTFRAVLDAMARPGRVHRVAAPSEPPPPLDRATAAVLLTLADADTKLWLGEAASQAREWVAFHCGAPAADAAQADFAVALAAPPLAGLNPGTDEEPETSATLILQLDALGDGREFRLEGPGLAAPARLRAPLDDAFVAFWRDNRRLTPRGIDVILCAGDLLAALPRTVTLEPA